MAKRANTMRARRRRTFSGARRTDPAGSSRIQVLVAVAALITAAGTVAGVVVMSMNSDTGHGTTNAAPNQNSHSSNSTQASAADRGSSVAIGGPSVTYTSPSATTQAKGSKESIDASGGAVQQPESTGAAPPGQPLAAGTSSQQSSTATQTGSAGQNQVSGQSAGSGPGTDQQTTNVQNITTGPVGKLNVIQKSVVGCKRISAGSGR
jgi:hypothetical protein